MSSLSERIRQIREHIQDLNIRVNDLTNTTTESDSVSRYKRGLVGLVTGPIAPIGIQSIHQGNSQAVAKITPKTQGVQIDLFIDDILDSDISELSYKFTNIDFRMTNTEMMGIIYQGNGIIRMEKISLVYSGDLQKYMLNIQSAQPFTRGRIFIPVNLIITLANADSNAVTLEPLVPSSGPGSGSGCRPESTPSTQSFEWPTLEQLSVLRGPVPKSSQKVNNPFN